MTSGETIRGYSRNTTPSSCPLNPIKQVLDYANVTVAVSDLLLQFTRGRDEFHVSIAPAHEPDDWYELGEGRWLVSDDGSRIIWGNLAYLVLATVALYFWHKEPPAKHITEPSEWAAAIVASVLMGAVSFGIDMIVGLISNPKLSPVEAGTKAGSPFGFPLTVMLCPGFTMIAIAGLLRALLLRTGATSAGQS